MTTGRAASLPSYTIPQLAQDEDFVFKFEQLCKESNVNPVNHGEFETAARALLDVSQFKDDQRGERCKTFVVQRCRRGGKTFMLHAVAYHLCKILESETADKNRRCHVMLLSLNTNTPYNDGEDPYTAILSRIAYRWERILGENRYFHQFRRLYSDYEAVREWLGNNNVILLIDELNKISPDTRNYDTMSEMLDQLVGRQGCALMYSTHLRDYADILRGRNSEGSYQLSTRMHEFMPIPRVRNFDCLLGLKSDSSKDLSLWSAVLRGRIPSLIRLDVCDISNYAQLSFEREAAARMDPNKFDPTGQDLEENTLTRRIIGLSSALTGGVGVLDGNYRDEFKAYSYMTQRKKNKRHLYAWPPFLLADEDVLGKDYPILRETLCSPQIDEAKAFEALTQLAILIRLLTSRSHNLVPAFTEELTPAAVFNATEMYHVTEKAVDLDSLTERITEKYSLRPEVMQVVVVPMFASFPAYDFFVFHRVDEKWVPAAGYQCRLGQETPEEKNRAWNDVGLSVWIGGSCRTYRGVGDGERVPSTRRYGWVVMGASVQYDLLGVSISEALPENISSLNSPPCVMCEAEMSVQAYREALTEEPKRQKT